MSATIVRRMLLMLAPVELALVALVAAGVALPPAVRFVVVALLASTVAAELVL